MSCRKRMVGCKRGCLHRDMVQQYRLWRETEELRREAATGSYASEVADYGPLPTFREWLVSMRGAAFDQAA